MMENWRNRALSDSRRFKRSSFHEPQAPTTRVQHKILEMIEQATPRYLLLLHILAEIGMDGLKRLENPEFAQLYGFVHGIFRIGPIEQMGDDKTNDNGIGLAIMPAQKVIGKEYPRAAVIIPIQVINDGHEDVFIIAISNRPGTRYEIDVSVAWRDSKKRNEWPDDIDILCELRDKVYEVTRIVATLDPAMAMRAA